ncbi:calmodulin-binding protein 60 A-like isoform X2 [Actinidia eriantha]|uniref:calmodulin-binding protein 60 A-like isoform X2 n=2 Tax=Actinidia eriantha TaxID=165200 RepID=UPI00258AB5E0|nr:calmodulin-binding protein 60 A-like isoform X2 [Actinidia eriantha]
MSHKRQQESNRSEDKSGKRRSFRNVVLDVISLQKFQLYMEPVLEPLIRRVVKEEVEVALKKYLASMKRNRGKEMHSSESRSLQLQFLPKISLPVFTGTRIEGEDCNSLKVALVDVLTGEIVYSGPESLAKVEIVVLEGDFDGDEGGNWTLDEFKNNIVREREGKKPLLTGDAFLNLKDGIGVVGEISFTDNSSWTRSRKFRLGARVIDNFDGIRIREATTESFIVRDHRGELYKKHHPPSLLDEVWRLEKIGKDGAFHKRLSREKVYTVKDFLTLLFIDPTGLRNILGAGMSAKMWEVTVDHARTCVLDSRLFFYCPPGSQQKTGVAFNVVGQVMGLLSECQYSPLDKLSETEKAEAHNLVIAAFKQWKDVHPFDDEASLLDWSSRLFNNDVYTNSAMGETSDGAKILTSQQIEGFDYPPPSVCSPDVIPSMYSIGGMTSLDDLGLYDQPLSFPGQVANSLICETESIAQAFCEDEHLRYFEADCSLQPPTSSLESESDLHCAVNGFLLARSPAFAPSAQRRWKKVFSVLRWFSVRRTVAKKSLDRERLRHR